eukprot:m.171706 g.171706  ORF g.171706 m.171706 type:complete len:106 (+) comp14558_c1_seq1:375-692(+)
MSVAMGFPMPWSCMSAEEEQPPRRRIDKSLIGQPTNFVHASHLGTSNVGAQMTTIKDQMSSKGGDSGDAQSTAATSVNALSLEEAQKKFGSKAAAPADDASAASE